MQGLARIRHGGRSHNVLITAIAFLALLTGGLAGAWLADRQWIEAGLRVPSRVVREKRRFWVVDADDPEACCSLIDLLHAEQERRESADAHLRTLEGARERDPPCS